MLGRSSLLRRPTPGPLPVIRPSLAWAREQIRCFVGEPDNTQWTPDDAVDSGVPLRKTRVGPPRTGPNGITNWGEDSRAWKKKQGGKSKRQDKGTSFSKYYVGSVSGKQAPSLGFRASRDSFKAFHREEKKRYEKLQYPGVRIGTVTCADPRTTTIDTLLEQIQMETADIGNLDAFRPSQLTILLTPAYARQATDDGLPGALLDRLYGSTGDLWSLDVVVAVVDKVFTIAGAGNYRDYAGDEGLSYCFVANPEKPITDGQKPLQPSAQKPGSLTFELPASGVREEDRFIQMPLAQTIFSTGQVSTMSYRRYFRASPNDPLQLEHKQQLESQCIRLPLDSATGESMVYCPLVPLTPTRNIKYVMGNIIRQLSSTPSFEQPSEGIEGHWTDVDHGDAMPASSELEEQVTQYFQNLGLSPEPVNVWALVIPGELNLKEVKGKAVSEAIRLLTYRKESLTTSWSPTLRSETRQRRFMHGLRQLTYHGARLIKVLSGGGGWGKKAGLLSLDPDVEYSTRELRQDSGWHFKFDTGDDADADAVNAQQRKEALGEIVKRGDRITFFLAPKLENLPFRSREQSEKHTQYASMVASFGVTPSTIDALPDSSGSADSGSVPAMQHFSNLFGMLSEGGMALSVRGFDGRVHKTKFDVPYGRWGGLQRWNKESVPSNLEAQTMTALDDKAFVTPGRELDGSGIIRTVNSKRRVERRVPEDHDQSRRRGIPRDE